MFEGHDPYLVALSVVIAILGGYTGFGLTARIRGTPDAGHRLLLAGAAFFLAIGIWTMHFVGMLAAPLPPGTVYLVLPTIISFLICALVVGISLFFVSVGEPPVSRVVSSAVLLGVGIASMHYVGMHGLSGDFAMTHDNAVVALSVAIAIAAAYGGLRTFLARQGGVQLALSAVAFGVAVSGMHYTAMAGMNLVSPSEGAHHHIEGLAASSQMLSLVVALLCFVIAAGFLLSLVPDPRNKVGVTAAGATPQAVSLVTEIPSADAGAASTSPRMRPTPLGGIGQPPRAAPAPRMPVEGADGTHFIDSADVRSVRADAHYTKVHDGTRERMCPWSISEAEAQLDPGLFVRVHRSHIVAIPHVTLVRKEGDGAIVELDGPSPHRVPVSRAKIAEVKARLGLARRHA
ncbi:carbon monoxide dehydrogenase [Bradyrhizobium sp. KBS0727]|jgi:NO-binding membrane sensor protein with MHYT domain|uniref:MHYT domain-containing protein n=1 Tax=unclassified Bradyrhizobium TaxID=2631580 RepID=UPI00110EC0F7|nr:MULTISPECIES: MHYT domain-containing protein [unclassified Bradyrhizobium]QDW36751.1 carbon monoxide dehydrogenase [Bradyrhizobium sp. KBS0725]QDW43352.1 carbon monoxide dehydrogenase [Bradyrhizobium sp. KBS0727]